MSKEKVRQERILNPVSGYLMLLLGIVGMIAGIAIMIAGFIAGSRVGSGALAVISVILGIIVLTAAIILLCGLKVLNPNEAYVFTVFGNYYGTLKKEGFFLGQSFLFCHQPDSKVGPCRGGVRQWAVRLRVCGRQGKESFHADNDAG